jgi:hypothetical protein
MTAPDPVERDPLERADARSLQSGRAINPGNALALAVSVFALAIGAYQTHLMQGQARASVWPFLTIGYTYSNDTDDNGFIWQVDNNGVGPAKVQTVTLSLDGKPMRHWSEVLTALGVTAPTPHSTTSLVGDVIPPSINRETTVPAIRINARDTASRFHDALARLRMEICYCSVYDDCWISRFQHNGAEEVARCEAPAVAFED